MIINGLRGRRQKGRRAAWCTARQWFP